MNVNPDDNDLKCDGDCGFYFNPGQLVEIDSRVYCRNEPAVREAFAHAREYFAVLHADR